MTKDNTKPMTATDFWATDQEPNVNPFAEPFQFAEAYADYRMAFYLKNKPTKRFAERLQEVKDQQQSQPLDPFEGAQEWARFRAANPDGKEFWFYERPTIHNSPATNYWIHGGSEHSLCPDRRLTYTDWRQSLVKRPARS